MTNVAIIYYSSTGTNYKMAQWAAEGAKEAGASDVRVLKLRETAPEGAIDSNPAWRAHVDATKEISTVTLEDLEWADAIIWSVPTRFGNVPSQFQNFIDTTGGLWFQGKLANKVVSAMASAGNANGGQEVTVHSIYTTMYHWGAIVTAPGFVDQSAYAAGGNPYGTSATVSQEGEIVEQVEEAVKAQARRTTEVAKATASLRA